MAIYFIDNYKSDTTNYLFQSISNSFVNITIDNSNNEYFLDQDFLDKELLNVKTALGNNDQIDLSVIEVACSNIANAQNELDQHCNQLDKVMRISISKFDQYQEELKDYDHQLAEFKKKILDLITQAKDDAKDEIANKFKTLIQPYNDALYQSRADVETNIKECGELKALLRQRIFINDRLDKSVETLKEYLANESIRDNTASILGKSMMDCANEMINRYDKLISTRSDLFSKSNSESVERIKANYLKMDDLNTKIKQTFQND
tara:strand:+ start:1679 stop:2467 length:789 start_codon:yes stop_codon:yes gene_type:complete